jgi:hypothetical protein
MRRSLTEDDQHKTARAIVEHLDQSNWKIEQGPMRAGLVERVEINLRWSSSLTARPSR